MSNVDRRDFLKLVGAGGVGAGAGFMLAESIKHPVEHLVPYSVPPEEYSPGVATWYNSVCGMCSAGCGITVRTREGRAKKIEGNPSHPVNQGRLCALGQAGLQTLYNPDRITAPMLRSGDRGSGGFTQTTWDDGLNRVAERLADAQRGSGDTYLLSQGVRGNLDNLLGLFMAGLGSENLLHYDFDHPHSLYAANSKTFGEELLPYYDIQNASYLLSFGADYLNDWLSPVHNSLGFGRSRQGGEHARGRFVQVEPKMSISGAAADEWIPAQPGTEGVLALGVAHQLVAGGNYAGVDLAAWTSALAPYSAASVAAQTGVSADTVTRLGAEFAAADSPLAIGGGATAGHTNAVDALVAINALNHLAGNIGQAGGIIFNPQPVTGSGANSRQANYQAMLDLADNARAGRISVLIINNTNPVFTMPAAARFAEALESVPLIVSLSTFMDETTALADIVLPSHTYLESWGDDIPQPGVGFSVAAISQPIVAPLYNTLGTGDIVLELGRRLGLTDLMPWADTEELLKVAWQQIYERDSAEAGGDFDAFWRSVLQAGVWGENVRRDDTPAIDPGVVESLSVADAEFAGSESDYPFVLHPYLSTSMHDGRGANLPWMQELPDPMTSVVYGTWVEMNPATAAEQGLKDGDLVQVTSSEGSLEAPLLVFPAIMPGVVAMPIGQGHAEYGRYANNRGANVISILASEMDSASGGLASSATRVSINATGKRARLVRTGGESRQLGRNIVQNTGDGDSGTAGHSARLNSIPIVVEST
jgi:anaerobic selenocysteine-containing dehydrogenase